MIKVIFETKHFRAWLNPSWNALSIIYFQKCVTFRIGRLLVRIGDYEKYAAGLNRWPQARIKFGW